MSKIVNVRFTPEELEMLDSVRMSEARGDLDRSGLIRLLIRREYNRRRRLGPPKHHEYDGSFRTGRPRKNRITD